MEVPLSIFLYIYLGLIVVCGLFFLANLYHVIRFGTLNFSTVFISFIFIAGLVLIVYFSYNQIHLIDWHQKIDLSSWFPFYKFKLKLLESFPSSQDLQGPSSSDLNNF